MAKMALNTEQKEAVNHINGPLQCIAAAGSGKTRVLIERINHMIKKGMAPQNILAITFTQKAAMEMQERLVKANPNAKNVNIGTFHSVAYRILRKELFAEEAMTIAKEAEIYEILRRLSVEVKMNTGEEMTAENIRPYIAWCKNRLILPDANSTDDVKMKIYAQYEEQLNMRKMIDFDDMLIKLWKLFKENPIMHRKYLNLYKFILVDEFQDTNHAQYEMLKLLAAHGNIFIVGDARQAIYSFRDARIEYMMNFEREWFGTKVVYLNTNYRCAQRIIDVSNQFIQGGSGDYPGTCIAASKEKGDVIGAAYDNEFAEAAGIARRIREYLEQGYSYNDMAVLFRVNAQVSPIEDQLTRDDIPYKNHAKSSFFELPEIEVILGYLRAVYSEIDDVLFRLIFNSPYRFISKETIECIEGIAVEKDLTLFEACPYAIKERPENTDGVKKFINIIEQLKGMENEKPTKIISYVMETTNLEEWLKKQEKAQSQEGKKIENVMSIVTMAGRHETAMSLLETVERIKMYANQSSRSEDKIHLMTLHASKGLEFPIVFIAGVADGRLPHKYAIKKKADYTELEQERRLFYVGQTRAKLKLIISTTKNYNEKVVRGCSFYEELFG